MTLPADFSRLSRDWMSEPVWMPPTLKEPFGLPGAGSVQRSTLVMVLARGLGMEGRLEGRPFRMTTNLLLLDFIPRLGHVTDLVRVPVAPIAQAVVSGSVTADLPPPLDLAVAVGAVLDFGWSHHSISEAATPSALSVLDDIAALYRDTMEARILRMLRQWEGRGWIEDKSS